MKRIPKKNLFIPPLILACCTSIPAFADTMNSSGTQGQMGFASDYTRRGTAANRQVHDYQGSTSTNTPRSSGGLPPTTTAVLGGVFGSPDYSTDWGPLPDDVAPMENRIQPAGAGAASNPGGGYHGQVGGIIRTGSWNPSSLGSGF